LPPAPVDFHLLGPLEAVAAGEALPLGGPKQRALLALLLIHAGEVVSTDTLIDELWGDSPPRTAPAYVQNCVSRLRKVLGPDLLETRPPGYALHAPPATIDARRFEQIVHDARGLAAGERAGALREALALWRGAALADLAFETFAQTEARRLEELRVAALEDRIEAELELGLHAELVGELEGLAREHPAREQLRRLQMLALYRSGRQVDALAAYQEARLALDELGLEPSEELRALERMILVHDPSLGAAAPERPEAAPAAVPVREARRPVCVLLAELVLDPALDPEAARREASRCLAEAEAIVERHGGTVEQLLGEEVVAIFGVPAAHEDDALRALRAAVELREAVAPVVVRAAAVAGELVVGGRSLSGGAITIARRVKESSTAGEILLGPRLRRLAGAAAETDGLRLLGLVQGARQLPVRLDTPFVGRQAELEQLQLAAKETFSARSCRHVVVVGDPGVGKSRLATELAASLEGEARVLTGRCVPYGEGATYQPLRDVLGDAFDPADLYRSLLNAFKGEENGSRIAEFLVWAVSATSSPATSGDTQWAARRLLEALAAKRPLLVVLEDLHWAEPTFLDLVEYVAGWSEGAALVLLSLTRPELLDARPAWGNGAIALRPLTREEAVTLVQELPEAQDVGDEALADVLDAAEGNPLFLEQLAAVAAEQGLVPGRIPHSLDALLASRLDRLSADERAVLERAAIAGREFTRRAVEALWESEEAGTVSRCLMAFTRRRLVQPDRTVAAGDDAFRFDHVLIRDAAYAAITKRERARFHKELGRWLDEGGELDEIVGHHLEQAALYKIELGEADAALAGEAAARLGAAGRRAMWAAAPTAVTLFERAIALEPDDERRLELELDHGAVLKFSGDLARGEAALESVARSARVSGSRRIELRAEVELFWVRWSHGDMTTDQGLKLCDEAIAVFEAAGDDLSTARALHISSAFSSNTGSYADAETRALRAREHYRRAGIGPELMATALAAIEARGPTPASEAISRCWELLSEVPGLGWRSFVLPLLAWLEAMTGRFDDARGHLEEARLGRSDFSDPGSIATSWANLAGQVELLGGDAEAAEAILSEACDGLRRSGDAWLATNLGALAEAVYRQGRYEEALALAKEATTLAPPDDRIGLGLAQLALAKALARTGKHVQAERVARKAVTERESWDLLNDRAESLLTLAEVLELRGKTTEAAEALEQAHALFEAKGNVVATDRIRASLLALAGQGEPAARAPLG
jgi:DNA-binding SARP family transcriptional activator/tetratricopeptide (TPR) repeat protein